MTPYRVNVADLVHRPGARRRERVRGPLAGLRVLDTEVEAGADLVVDTRLEWVTEGILATGSVVALWRSQCRRCLLPMEGEAEVRFQELFEARPTDGESYPLTHDHIDLEPLVREALLLDLPLAPLCGVACRGLCPLCGADLNREPCGCQPGDTDPRWAALDELREDSE